MLVCKFCDLRCFRKTKSSKRKKENTETLLYIPKNEKLDISTYIKEQTLKPTTPPVVRQ